MLVISALNRLNASFYAHLAVDDLALVDKLASAVRDLDDIASEALRTEICDVG